MPTTTTLTRPRPLSKTALSTHFTTSKPQIFYDPSAPSSSSGPLRRGLASSSFDTSSIGTGGTSNTIRTLAWSPTGSLLATADARVLRVWNPDRPGIKNSTELKIPPSSSTSSATANAPTGPGRPATSSSSASASSQGQHVAGTERVAWNPTREAELASVGADGVMRFWDVRARGSSACVGEVKLGGEGFSLAWRPDGSEIVVGRKDDTLIPVSRTALTTLAQHRQSVQTNQIAFTNSGNELLLTTGDSQVKIVDYPSMSILHTLTAHTSSCYTVTPSPTGRHIAIGGSDALITLWNTSDFTCRHTLPELGGPVRSLSFSFDGSYIVGGSDEAGAFSGGGGGGGGPSGGGLQIAHVETGEYVTSVETRGPAAAVQWHPSRYVIAFGGDGGSLRVAGAGV